MAHMPTIPVTEKRVGGIRIEIAIAIEIEPPWDREKVTRVAKSRKRK